MKKFISKVYVFECLLPHQIVFFQRECRLLWTLHTIKAIFFLKIISPFDPHNSFMSKKQLSFLVAS